MNPSTWPGAFKQIKPAFDGLRLNLVPASIYAVVQGVVQYFSSHRNGSSYNLENGVQSIGPLASLVVLLLIPAGVVLQLRSADHQKVELNEWLQLSARKFFPVVAYFILSGIVIVVGLVLLIVPGLIALTRLSMGQYLIVDKSVGPIEAMKQSWNLTKGHAGKIWGAIGVAIVVGLVVSILVSWIPLVGVIITSAASLLIGVVFAMLYRWINANGGAVAAAAPAAPAATPAESAKPAGDSEKSS
jgi:hypothetical protein